MEPEDVVYHGGSVHFLTQGEHILECAPVLDDIGFVLEVTVDLIRFQNAGRSYAEFVRARYLVASREELLMVVRFAPSPHAPTSSFKVFRMLQQKMPDDGKEKADEHHGTGASWTRWVAGCCSWGEDAPDPTRLISTWGSRTASTSWMMGASTTTRSCSAVSMIGGTLAATSASGRKGRLPMSNASSRSRALRATLLRLGFSLETASFWPRTSTDI